MSKTISIPPRIDAEVMLPPAAVGSRVIELLNARDVGVHEERAALTYMGCPVKLNPGLSGYDRTKFYLVKPPEGR